MDMRTGTIGNGVQSAVWRTRATAKDGGGSSGFAAQMAALTDSMTLADPTGDPTLRAAYDQLSAASRDVLERMKAGQGEVTQDEWTGLCRELKDAGIISESDFAYTRADLRVVPLMTCGMEDGCAVVSGGGFPLLSQAKDSEWSGDPLQFLDEWMGTLRNMRAQAADQRLADGARPVQFMNALTGCIGSCGKVSGLVKDLMKLC